MRICIPIRAKNYKAARNQLKKAVKQVESDKSNLKFLIEIWLDSLLENEIANLIKTAKIPVIAVCKSREEKGSFRGSEEDRIDKLKKAVLSGARYVDCGIYTQKSLIKELGKTCKKYGAKLIISRHFWKNTPDISELEKVVKKAKTLGADIVKIAVTADKWACNAMLFELVKRAREKKIEIIAVGMGKEGKLSRIGCLLLGGYLTYVALDNKSKTAKGQLILPELKSYFVI